jgi:hypothetical protein
MPRREPSPPRELAGSASTASRPAEPADSGRSVGEAQVGDAAAAQCCRDLRGGGPANHVQLTPSGRGPTRFRSAANSSAARLIVHIPLQQNDRSGSPVTWGEHVGDEQYGAAPGTDWTA